MTLKDLLLVEEVERLVPIMERIAEGHLDPSSGKLQMMEILWPLKNRLEEKGVVADYLAWFLVNQAIKIGGRRDRHEVLRTLLRN